MADTQYDVIVIGGGPGGYVAAIRAAQLGMKIAPSRAQSRRRQNMGYQSQWFVHARLQRRPSAQSSGLAAPRQGRRVLDEEK
ncbi:FAD-binding protein [Anaerolineae bacterium CFX7]|nr:FAD-binding protein [Anaerolineae bacterium CFX7]